VLAVGWLAGWSEEAELARFETWGALLVASSSCALLVASSSPRSTVTEVRDYCYSASDQCTV
jgi:hypothetical protein